MAYRTHESPMDYEYQNGQGPIDPSSPFTFNRNITQRRGFQNDNFSTPSKPLQPISGNVASSFMSANTSKPAKPFSNPAFTTPRKPFLDIDMLSEQSGPESSPADVTDDQDTPEATPNTNTSTKMVNFTATKIRKPIFGKYGRYWKDSPKTGESRGIDRHIDNAVSKVKKRKRIDRDHYALQRRHSQDTEDDESAHSRPLQKGGSDKQKEGFIGSFFTNLENRPNLPYVLSHYPQILLNYFLLGTVCWLIYTFIATIRRDMAKATDEAELEVLHEIAKCASEYTTNHCAPHTRVPGMAMSCQAWELCMNRDPTAVAKASLGAKAFGQIFNSFIEPISWKAMLFIALLFTIALGVSHTLGGQARAASHTVPIPTIPQSEHWYATPRPPQDIYGQPQWTRNQQMFGELYPPATPSQRQLSRGSNKEWEREEEEEPEEFKRIMPSTTPGRDRSPRKTSRH